MKLIADIIKFFPVWILPALPNLHLPPLPLFSAFADTNLSSDQEQENAPMFMLIRFRLFHLSDQMEQLPHISST